MTFYIFLALSTFMISLIGTRLTIITQRKRMLPTIAMLRDGAPMPAPSGGGIVVVITLCIGLLLAEIDYGIILSLLLLAAVALMDDVIGVPRLVKLLVQAVAVMFPLSMLPPEPIFSATLAPWLDKSIVVVLWIGFINVFKNMDTVDGLSAVETIGIAGGLCFIAILLGAFPNNLSVYSLVAATAACGFWWWNRYPARILLGNVGSVPLGFLLGYLLLLAITSGYEYAAAILPAYYIADSCLSALAALFWRESSGRPRHEHYYQKAVRLGRRPKVIAWYICGINILLVGLASLTVLEPDLAIFNVALAYMAVFMLLGFFAHHSHHVHHEPS